MMDATNVIRRCMAALRHHAVCVHMLASDGGSGTIAGAMLVMVAGMLLSVVAIAGNLLVCQTRARAIADLSVIQAAVVWHDGDMDDPCLLASDVVVANGGRLSRCVVDGEDVEIGVVMTTMVPMAPEVERAARAGPVQCEES